MSDVRHRLYHCWRKGMGLRASAQAVARDLGLPLERETVRRHFVDFAAAHPEQSQPS